MKPKPRYQPGDKIGGRYQVHQALMGGMGEVYLCLYLEENIPLALKTFQRRHMGDSQLVRVAFEREVATWVALEKHPNIVRCFLMDILDNQPFMFLEWVIGELGRGTDLRSWMRHGSLDLRTVLDFTIDICRGLIHAQEKQPGLVHRDLKPENVLVARGRLAKITDFGLAQVIHQAGLESDTSGIETDGRQSVIGWKGVAGTPAYMAPEQWQGENLDERVDIYALGCMLYEMLTGERPFQVDFVPTAPQQIQQWLDAMQAKHESASVPALPTSLPATLGDLVYSCLAKTRADRPLSVSELLHRLEDVYQQQFETVPRAAPTSEQFAADEYSGRGATYHQLRRYEDALRDFDRARPPFRK